MTYVLGGLTGGIAAGKTTVSDYLKKAGAVVIDADVIARTVVCPGTPGLKQIVAVFGTEILTSKGQLARQKLGNLVFADQHKLASLNRIMGPLIHAEIYRQLKVYKEKKVKLLVLAIPLLFEGGYAKYCDSVMTISSSKTLQLQRLMNRDGLTQQQAKERLEAQMSEKERNQRADIVIDNTKEVEETLSQVLKWLITNGFAEKA